MRVRHWDTTSQSLTGSFVPAEAWWLDGVTQQMVEQQLNLGRALTFTLRAGHPIVLTREQVRALPSTMLPQHFHAVSATAEHQLCRSKPAGLDTEKCSPVHPPLSTTGKP